MDKNINPLDKPFGEEDVFPKSDIVVEQKESIKLTKNAKGFFQWEIKLLDEKDIRTQLNRLHEINEQLNELYNTQEEEK